MTLLGMIWYYLWIAPYALQGVLLVVMVRRRIYRQFPVFFAYTAFEVCQFVVLFAMDRSAAVSAEAYAYAFGWALAVSTALRFGILREILAHLFRDYAAFGKFGRPIFRSATVVLLFAALALAVYTGGNNANGVMLAVHVADRTASILQCGLLMCLFLFSTYLGLSWRNHVFGIALGLGIFASVELIVSSMRAQFTLPYSADLLTMGTYHGCVLLWIFYLWAPERRSQFDLRALPNTDLEIWNRELERLIHQ
jgi:hypothetical protein